MKCPNCQSEIPDDVIAKALAAKGGRKSKRKITPEQQENMQNARRRSQK